MPLIAAPELADLTCRVLEAAGASPDEASIVARGLVEANLRGHDSHGVMRLPQYVAFLEKGEYRAGVDLRIERDTPAVILCDGQWGFGQVQAHRMLDLLLPRAKSLGLAAGAARQCGHVGRLGEYAERAAEEGIVLIATVNNCGAGQRVAPPGGREPRIGTNPLCVGVPTADGPVILDFGTSVAAEGKVRVHHISGTPVPEGWLLDSSGLPTTDASVLYGQPSGSILPMGGPQAYKGFGLALVLDMLAGGLTGGRSCFAGAPAAKGNNLVFLALDPALFAGREAMLREASDLAAYIRGCPRAEGVEAILLPGDPERRMMEVRSTGGIPVPEAHWERLSELAGRLGVALADPDGVDSAGRQG